jgi:hypothetical protein
MINSILYKLRLKKRPESQLDRGAILQSLPLRNQLIEWEVDDNGEVSLVIPQKETVWLRLVAKLFMLPPKRVVVLDDVGAFVWQLCDGHNSIGHIVKQLCGKYRMTRKEAETSLFTFMRQLGKRGMVGFAVPQQSKKGRK